MSKANNWHIFRGEKGLHVKRNNILGRENVHIFTQHWITTNSTAKMCFHLDRDHISIGVGAFPMEGIEIIKGDPELNESEDPVEIQIEIIKRYK